MVMESASCLGVNNNNIIPQFPEGLDYLLAEIESEFYNSEIYFQALMSLEKIITNSDRHIYSLEETTKAAQKILVTTCKQAIKIAFQKVNKTKENLPNTSSTNTANTGNTVLAEKNLWSQNSNWSAPVLEKPTAIIPTWSETHVKTYSNINTCIDKAPNHRSPVNIKTSLWKKLGVTPATKTPYPEQQSQNIIEQEQKTQLLKLGQQLQQARINRSLSIYDLQRQTLISAHAIEALETGNLQQLPEDIYVRGFIRRLGDVLGLDGNNMADSLPKLDPIQSLTPSWYHPQETSTIKIQPIHLYMGYAAIMAGAVGGMALLSHQSIPETNLNPDSNIPSHSDLSHLDLQTKPLPKTPTKFSQHNIAANINIAPPESHAQKVVMRW